jgi:hypothetical protein
MISGIVSYIVMLLVGLSLMGAFGDLSSYDFVFGAALIAMFAWWVVRRFGIIPSY